MTPHADVVDGHSCDRLKLFVWLPGESRAADLDRRQRVHEDVRDM